MNARKMSRRGLAAAGLATLGVVAASGVAYAYWTAQATGVPTYAAADSVNAGSKPTATANGTSVDLSWTAVTTQAGRAVTGYVVKRYDAPSGGNLVSVAHGTCASTVATLSCTETGVADGTWYYTTTPVLGAWLGSESPRSAAVTVQSDVTAPVTTDNSASIGNGWKNANQTVTLSPTDAGSGVAATYYTTNGSTPTTSSAQGTSVAVTAEGATTVKYFSVDNAGNTEAVKSAGTQIRIDKTAPSAGSFTVPAAVKNGYTLTTPATDALSGVQKVEYYYRAGTSAPVPGVSGTLIGSSTSGPNYGVAWTSTPADGTYTLLAVVTDSAGNTASSAPVTTTLDNVGPTTTDNTNTIGNAWKTTDQTVTLTRSDTGGAGVATTYYTTDGSTPTTSSAQGASISLTTSGVYTIKYFSVDNAGNAEAVKTAGAQIQIDKTAPVAGTFTLPSVIKNGQVLSNAATDATSGVASVSYYYCAGTCTPVPGSGATLIGTSTTGPNYSVTWSAPQPADGTYTLLAQVTDNAGNKTSSSAVPTTIDNTVPTGFDVQANTGAGGDRKPSSGDTLTFTYSERIDPASLSSGWNGTGSVPVTVAFADGSPDVATIAAIGTVSLGDGNYVKNGNGNEYSLSANMTQATDGSGRTVVTITFTSSSTKAQVSTTATPQLTWTPAAGTAKDLAGNAITSTPVTESGTNDADF